jgi:Tfp pilus assembly protein FimT
MFAEADSSTVIVLAIIALVGTIGGPLLLTALTGAQRKAERHADEDRADVIAARLKAVEDQATVIHGLVNSDLTAALESELSSLIDVRKFRREKAASGTPEDQTALEAANTRIDKLQTRIADRVRQQHLAEAQVAERTARLAHQ